MSSILSRREILRRASRPPEPADLVRLSGGDSFLPTDWVVPGVVLCLARQDAYPGVRDYAGTFSDDDITGSDLAGVPRADRGELYLGDATNPSTLQASELELTEEGFWEIGFDLRLNSFARVSVFDYGGSGEDEASNYAWIIYVAPEAISMFSETGAGINKEASWTVPGRLADGGRYLVRLERNDADEVRCFVDGRQLKLVSNVAGTTPGSDGEAQGLSASGATAGDLFCIGQATALSPWWFRAGDDIDIDAFDVFADYATSDDLILTDAEYTARAGAEGTVICLKPTASGWEDVAGTLDAGDFSDRGAVTAYLDDQLFVTTAAFISNAPTQDGLSITGGIEIEANLIFRAVTTGWLFACGGNNELESGNTAWALELSSSTTLRYFAEQGSGADISVTWDLPRAVLAWDLATIRLTRTTDGDVSLLWNGELLEVASTTGTDNGTSANVPDPTGGSDNFTAIGTFAGGGDRPVSFNYFRVRQL